MDVLTNRKNDFDLQKFNVQFEAEKERKRKEQEMRMEGKLDELNQQPDGKKLVDYSVGELMISIKDTWFELLDDMLQYQITPATFMKGDRIFFIGLTIFIATVIVYLYAVLFEDSEGSNITKLEVKHIHEYLNQFPNN